MGTFETDQSVFNMAMAYLKRIDQVLYHCAESSRAQKIDEWLNNLMVLKRELSVKLKPEEKEELKAMIIEVSKYMNPEGRTKYKGWILTKLDEIEEWMRDKLQVRGMLLPNKEDASFAIGRRN